MITSETNNSNGTGWERSGVVLIEHGQQAMNGALVQGQALRDFAGRELAGILREHLQNVDGAFAHLDAIGRPFR